MLDLLFDFGIISSSIIQICESRGDFAMKRMLSDTLTRRREKTTACSSNATYESAMKVYKMFAYVSGAVITAAYVISQLF